MAFPKASSYHLKAFSVTSVALDRSLANCYFIRQKLENDLTSTISLASCFRLSRMALGSSRLQQVAYEFGRLDSKLDFKRGEDGKLLASLSSIGTWMRWSLREHFCFLPCRMGIFEWNYLALFQDWCLWYLGRVSLIPDGSVYFTTASRCSSCCPIG